jgi:hypothetical protein
MSDDPFLDRIREAEQLRHERRRTTEAASRTARRLSRIMREALVAQGESGWRASEKISN